MRSRATRSEWAARVERWQRSGQDAETFAATAGLKARQLTWWKWKLGAAKAAAPNTSSRRRRRRSDSAVPSLLPAHVVASSGSAAASGTGTVAIETPGGVVVRIPADVEPRWLAQGLCP